MLDVIQWVAMQLAAFQAALLLASALHQLMRRHRAQAVVHEFAGVPRYLAAPAVAVIAAVEALAGVLLLTPSYRAAGGALAALIFGTYLFLILRAIAQERRDVDCGCSFGAARRPLGAYQAVRNAGLTGMALLVAVVFASTVSGPVLGLQTTLAAFALLSLYAALDQVMTLMPPRTGELL